MNKKLRESLKYVFLGGITTSAKDTLAVGPTLIAYALCFGAGNFAIGCLSAVPYLGNLIHLLVAYLVEKGASVKKIAVWSSFVSPPFYLLAAFLAFWPDSPVSLPLLIFFLLMSYLIGCMSGGAFMPWMKELVPARLMGRFFSHRYKYMMIAKIACFLFAFFWLKEVQNNFPEKEIFAYAALLALAFVAALYSAWTFTRVADKPIRTKAELPFYQKVFLTFKNTPFRQLLTSLSVLNFSQAFVTPFVTVFLLKRLNMEMSSVIILTLILQASYTIIIKRWGKISDRFGPAKILLQSVPLFVLCMAILTGLNFYPDLNAFLLLGILGLCHVLLGIATAGITLGINNVSLLYIPRDTASVYLSVNSVFKSAAGALGSVTAGVVLTLCVFFEEKTARFFDFFSTNTNGWTSFYVITVVLCYVSIFLLKRIKNCENERI